MPRLDHPDFAIPVDNDTVDQLVAEGFGPSLSLEELGVLEPAVDGIRVA